MAPQPSETSPSRTTWVSRVRDWRVSPAGVVPRHLQQWALGGIAVVMIGILALSGPTPTRRPATTPAPASLAIDPNQQRIEDYQAHVQEQAQRLTAEQAQLERAKDALLLSDDSDPSRVGRGVTAEHTVPSGQDNSREVRARFADNVAFSRPSAAAAPTPSVAAPSLADVPYPFPPPTMLSTSGLPGLPGGAAAPAPPAPVPTPQASTSPSNERRYTLFEGTVLETVLTNRLDGTFSGPVNCLVSVPVYAADHLVIPAGARILGEARPVSSFGQSRLAVAFHRVLLPGGGSINLDQFPGLNQSGDLGLRDQVDRHYAQIFGVSLALGAIAGLAQSQTAVGLSATSADTYRQGVASNVAQSSTRVLDRFLNLLPTVTIREGHRIKVYLSHDLALPEYRPIAGTGGRS